MLHLSYALASPSASILPKVPVSSTVVGTVKISPIEALQVAVTTHKLRNQMYEEIEIYLL